MKNRLEIARELLKDDGVIFIQCDDNEQAYLKVLCDKVFGRENFVGNLIRQTRTSSMNNKDGFNTQHDIILLYEKNRYKTYFVGEEKDFSNYTNPDNDPYGDWIIDNPSTIGGNVFDIINPYTKRVDKPPLNRGWSFTEEKLKELIKIGKIVFKKEYKENERGFILKRYKKDLKSNVNTFDSLSMSNKEFLNAIGTKENNILFGEDSFKFPKPEKILEKIINSSTQPHDIVLDFFAGSGTTGAVAHKMNRQWIMVEQMDYIESITRERLKKVIEGEQGGISKSVNWQGGGDFVYFELKKYNQDFIEMLEKCETKDEVLNVFNEICEKGFVKYNVDIKALKEDISKGENSIFLSKTLEEMKENVYSILEKNMIYLPYSMLYDDKFKCSVEEKKLSKDFYKNLLNEDGE